MCLPVRFSCRLFPGTNRALFALEPKLGPGSGQVVDRVRQLEGPLGDAAGEIALLISHAQDDGIALLGNLPPLRCLEVHRTLEVRALGKQNDRGWFVALFPEVSLGRIAQVGGTAADEEHRYTELMGAPGQLSSGAERLGPAERLPGPETTRTVLEVAPSSHYSTPPVQAIGRPVRQRGLIDIEHDRGLLRRFRPLLQPLLRPGDHRREVPIVPARADILVDLLLRCIETGYVGGDGSRGNSGRASLSCSSGTREREGGQRRDAKRSQPG